MRLLLTVSTAALVASLACGSVGAQQRPGWVDPPAKGAQGGETQSRGTRTEAPKAAPPAETAEEPPARETAPRSTAETVPAARSGPNGTADEEPAARRSRRAETPRRRPRVVEVRRERRMRAAHEERRFAAPSARSEALAGRPPDARFAEWAPAAQRLTEAYLDTVSGSNAALVASAPRFYAERVRFYGRDVGLSALIADKRRFAQRWPNRRYEPQAMRTACDEATATCVVHTTVLFTAVNPSRGARSQGVTELVLTVSFAGERPVIVGETGQVLRRGAALGSLVPAVRGA